MRITTPVSSLASAVKNARVILLDNFGVLTRGEVPLPGVIEACNKLRDMGKELYVLSNTANFSPAFLNDRFLREGLFFELEHIITSGMVLKPYFESRKLVGSRVLCLGNATSMNYVRLAGGDVINPDNDDLSQMERIRDEA